MANTRTYKHKVTQDNLDAHPELATAGINVGDELKITVSTKAAGLSAEDAAAELKAALLAAKDAAVKAGDDDDEETELGAKGEDKNPWLDALTKYFEGNAKGSTNRAESIDASAKWLKGDIMGAVRNMGGNVVTKGLFTSFAQELCKGVDGLAEELKGK